MVLKGHRYGNELTAKFGREKKLVFSLLPGSFARKEEGTGRVLQNH